MRTLTRLTALTGALVLAGCLGSEDGPTEPTSTVLTPGVFRTISGQGGTPRTYTVVVPAGTGTLRVELRSGGLTPDLRIRAGIAPEEFNYDCISDVESSVQECIIDTPTPGTWHIAVESNTGFSGVGLRASLGAESGAVALTSGVGVPALSGAEGSFRMFSISVPAGERLVVTTRGGTGDADLFVRRGAFALMSQWDCASLGDDNDEDCENTHAQASTWYVRVEGYAAYNGLTLTATILPAVP